MDYPAFNRQWKNGGRVLDLEVKGPFLNLKLSSGPLQIKYYPDYENIKVNDWIAVDENNQLVKVVASKAAPLSKSATRDTLKKWSLFLRQTRNFFDSKDFLEIHTPSLVLCPGTEPSLESFSTEIKLGSKNQKVFLPTSPELHLKKALTMGFERIYEVAKCYRNNEVTEIHQPEFWMLEWYRSYANLFDLQSDVVKLVYSLCEVFKVQKPDVRNFSIRQLFKKHLDFDLTASTSIDELKALAIKLDLRVTETFSIDDIFFLLMLEKIEPNLPKDCLVFVEKYPPYQAALARKDSEGWAERFEVYWKGMELANAFDELNNPLEQRQRAQEDISKREGKNPIGLDEEFFKALDSGMPPSAGIALGLERLFMAICGIKKIGEVRLFPINPY